VAAGASRASGSRTAAGPEGEWPAWSGISPFVRGSPKAAALLLATLSFPPQPASAASATIPAAKAAVFHFLFSDIVDTSPVEEERTPLPGAAGKRKAF
jgi:hypothetical protein